MTNKFMHDSGVLGLQHALASAKAETRTAVDSGCSDELICELMDAEDAIISQLLSKGCHLRDC
jgi:hypothetical protein